MVEPSAKQFSTFIILKYNFPGCSKEIRPALSLGLYCGLTLELEDHTMDKSSVRDPLSLSTLSWISMKIPGQVDRL